MKFRVLLLLLLALLPPAHAAKDAGEMPKGFVLLRDVAPAIRQDMRYFGNHNFLGRPVAGYQAPECILSIDAANALAGVQRDLEPWGLGLMVYDCYRPQRAVQDFVAWSKKTADQATKAEFYPRVDKKDFFKLGYVAEKSGHSRGSTVDVTIIPLNGPGPAAYAPGQALTPCTQPYDVRYKDGGLDMGTGFDCMDELSHPLSQGVPPLARANRMLLRQAMERHGFKPYDFEWWHFTLKNEPHPETYYDFPVNSFR
uniref:D-alanyl-D-alanine dipeptidase n=1 Tax=Fundidesulfovibrio putealis TaxID=270496 RepID=A0A7C4EJC9_9BACT